MTQSTSTQALAILAGLLMAASPATSNAQDAVEVPRGRAVVAPPKPTVETVVVPGTHDKAKAPKEGKRFQERMNRRTKDAKEKAEKAEKEGK